MQALHATFSVLAKSELSHRPSGVLMSMVWLVTMLPFKRAPSGAPGKNDSTENPNAGRRDFHPSDEAATQELYGSGFLPSPGAGESGAGSTRSMDCVRCYFCITQ
jgi:hypothetical protein